MKNIKLLLTLVCAFTFMTQTSFAQCDYTLNLFDAFGDGWEDNGFEDADIEVLVNGVSVGNYAVPVGAADATYSITVNDGDAIDLVYNNPGDAFASEHSFDLLDSDGTPVASNAGLLSDGDTSNTTASCGVAPPNDACDYTLNLFDAFGDGWEDNGFEDADIEVLVNGASVGNYAVPVGAADATYSITVNDGDAIDLVYNNPGDAFSNEHSFDLLDSDGASVAANGVLSDSDAFNVTASCPIAPVSITLVPTMGQWSLFLFGMGMMTLGLVFVYNKQRQLA